MKKTILLLSLIFFAGAASAQTDTRIKVMINDFEATPPVTTEEAQLQIEQLRKPLINAQTLTIVESPKAPAKGRKKPATAMDAARSVNAVFFITGKVSKEGNSYIISYELVNTYTGEPALAGNAPIVSHKDIEKVGADIVNVLKSYTGISYDDIKRMSDNEEWENVIRNINIFTIQYPNLEKARIETLRVQAAKKIAENRYKESLNYCNNYDFPNATKSIKISISNDPGNAVYRNYAAEIIRKEQLYARSNEALMLKSANQLIEEGKLKSAADILDKIPTKSPEVIKSRAVLREELEIIETFRRAKMLYSQEKYSLVRTTMQMPLKKKPDNKDFKNLIARVDKKEKEQAERERLVNELFSFYTDTTVFSMFLKPKNLNHHENISYIYSEYVQADQSDFIAGSTGYQRTIGMHGVEASFFKYYDLPFLKIPWNFISIKVTGVGSLVIAGNTNESESTLAGNRSVKTTTLMTSKITGGMGPTLSIFSILAGGGLDIETGYLRNSFNNNPLFSGIAEQSKTYHYMQLGIGYGFWAAWLPFENFQISFRYRVMKIALYGSEDTKAKNDFTHMSIGFGTRFY